MKRRNRLIGAFAAALMVNLTIAPSASAMAKDLEGFLSMIENMCRNASDNIVEIVLILIAIGTVLLALPTLFKHNSGDSTTKDAFLKLGTGVVIAFLIVQLAMLLT